MDFYHDDNDLREQLMLNLSNNNWKDLQDTPDEINFIFERDSSIHDRNILFFLLLNVPLYTPFPLMTRFTFIMFVLVGVLRCPFPPVWLYFILILFHTKSVMYKPQRKHHSKVHNHSTCQKLNLFWRNMASI